MSANEETRTKEPEASEEPAGAATLEETPAAAPAAGEDATKKDDDPTGTVSAQTTEEALAAAVAASAGFVSSEQQQPTAAGTTAAVEAAATATAGNAVSIPTDRDVILGEGSAGHKTNLLLQDIIRLHRILWKLHDKPPPTTRDEVKEMAIHIVELIQNGKAFELAGLKDVPKQFMKSTGLFFGPNPNPSNGGGDWVVLPHEEIQKTMCDIILEDFKVDDLGPLTDMPYKNLKEWISKKQDKDSNAAPFMPEGRDAILLPCRDFLGEKMYEHQAGNKTLFHLASQLVTSYTNTPEKRVEAALFIMKGLDDAESVSIGEKETTTTSKTRYLIRTQREDQSIAWDIMDAASAAEFTLIFTFEVFLEKEIHILPPSQMAGAGVLSSFPQEHDDIAPESIPPVPEPTDHDVLFGRGGMTNSHPGNRRFRDIIALHRPDYIRAVKMDKPSVARKIVRAIRYGNPPGRFLRKSDDGLWYDVGDRTAAEKTSQGLRERSNAEKRQRSALREALRIRKEDMVEEDEQQASKKAKGASGAAELSVASIAPTLNYVGTNLPVPLSLTMKEPVTVSRKKAASTPKKDGAGKPVPEELNTEGLPPNAVDEEGNILVTDYDILCGRGGLTNHHKGNKRFRDIVALHRPDYVRAPKIQKPSVARVIVRAIRNGDPPGRFLKKDEKTGKWIDVGDKKAAEKTSQALREKTSEERDKSKNGEAPVQGILLPSVTNAYLMASFPPTAAVATAADTAPAATTATETKKGEEAKSPEDEKKEAPSEPAATADTAAEGTKTEETMAAEVTKTEEKQESKEENVGDVIETEVV